MNNLLDTHTFIWFIEGDSRLSQEAIHTIESENIINYISIASIWEIAIKLSLGKLEMQTGFSSISDLILSNGFEILPITFQDTVCLTGLPFHHRDPFDRIIISQATTNKLQIITQDSSIPLYDVSFIW